MFWVDEITSDILEKQKKDSFLITDWKTPSGHVHIGALRGVVIHEVIKQSLELNQKEAQFQYGIDDYDPMDGLPVYIDKSFEKYMGLPLSNVPAPDGKSGSFAEQYANEFLDVIKKLGIKPHIVKTSDLYKSGKFNEAIKIILDNADAIRTIYKEISGSEKPKNWYPLNILCPKCGRVGTTEVTSWDGKEVEFTCKEDLVEWAKGCGYRGKISPFDGNGKLPWKVEWPSKWYIFKSDIEGEGKDHAAASGSRQVANEIYRKVFQKVPPYDIPYEHILIGGAKMSSSKGLGVTAYQMSEILPSNLLKFLFVRTRPKRAIEFNPEGNTIPLLYDEYDRSAKAFAEDPNLDLARAFYYTVTSLDNKTNLTTDFPKYLMRFSKIALMLQMPRVDIYKYALEEKASEAKSRGAEGDEGAINLIDIEREELEKRTDIAKKWLEKYAPEEVKFNITADLPLAAKDLVKEQKDFLKKIKETIEANAEIKGEDLHQAIHAIRKELEIEPRLAFGAIYLSFIGKESGPQTGWLLASLDKEFVIKRLAEASGAPIEIELEKKC